MEVKELLALLDIEIGDEATLEHAKDAIHDKFVSRAIAHEDADIRKKIMGRELGVLERNIKKGLKHLGFEELDDFNLKAFESDDPDVNPLYGVRSHYQQQIDKLKEEGGKGNSEKVKQLEEQLIKVNTDAKSYKEMLDAAKQEYSTLQENVEQEKKSWMINQSYQDAFKKHKLSDTVDEYKLKGFESVIKEKYKFDLDDNRVVVYNSDGERVKNKNKSDFASLEEVLGQELESANMLKKNNQDPERKQFTARQSSEPAPDSKTGRMMKANSASEKYHSR